MTAVVLEHEFVRSHRLPVQFVVCSVADQVTFVRNARAVQVQFEGGMLGLVRIDDDQHEVVRFLVQVDRGERAGRVVLEELLLQVVTHEARPNPFGELSENVEDLREDQLITVHVLEHQRLVTVVIQHRQPVDISGHVIVRDEMMQTDGQLDRRGHGAVVLEGAGRFGDPARLFEVEIQQPRPRRRFVSHQQILEGLR